MIPYGSQSIDKSDIDAVVKVLNSRWLTQGPAVIAFEEALASYCGAKYAVATNNGTSALYLAYLAAGLGKGDEVITTPNTFVATSNMLLAVGAKPVFCDIRLDTYNIDETKIESLITKKTKAIASVDIAGHPCDIENIKKIARKHKLLLIEDACQALGARIDDKRIGSLSDMTIFSFHPVKVITTGEGGAIATNNKKIYEKMKLLRSHGVVKDKKGFNVMIDFSHNFRLTDIQAALGSSQLEKIEKFLAYRHQVVKRYYQGLKNVEQIVLPQEQAGYFSGWHIYIIRTRKKSDRLKLFKYLRKNGIGVNFHYPCVFNHPYYRKIMKKPNNCPNALLYEQTAITLPLHALLTETNVKYIIDKIKNFFNQ